MTPKEFFEQVAEMNASLAGESPGDLRLAINAIMTLDAFFGILHASLHAIDTVEQKTDDQWKDVIAQSHFSYQVLRDAAYALKHGKLDGRKTRLVRRPEQIFGMPGAFDSTAFDNAFDTETIWIDTPGNDYRAAEVIADVTEIARKVLDQHRP